MTGVGVADVTIRRMAEGDLDRVLAIAASLREAPQWPRLSYEQAIAASQGSLRRAALVAELAGALCGFAVASLVGSEAELESIAVAEQAQGRGIGAALLTAVMRALRDLGAAQIVLEVRESNRKAAGLYARAGFLELGRRPEYYRNPVEDAILLGRNLDGSEF